MILTIFIIFLVLSILLVFAGHYVEAPPLMLGGYLFLFILGLGVIIGGLSYEAGTTYSYICACCENGTYKEGNITEYYSYICVGTPFDCGYYNESEANCLILGCYYNVTTLECSGTPDSCDTQLIERDCEAINCTWELDQEPTLTEGCTNGTITLKNETKVYGDYSGETGVIITRTIGFFLSIIGVLGWIIVLMNLKDGTISYGRGKNGEE